MKLLPIVVAAAGVLSAQLIPEVRQAAQAGEFAKAETRIQAARGGGPWSPETILAYSWLGRTAQASQKWDKALAYAAETRRLVMAALPSRPLDAEPDLPLALGASIEVRGHALANTGRRSEGVAFLKQELARWSDTSIRTRIQKNLHLLSLQGQKAPKLETKLFAGTEKIGSMEELRGRPVVVFLWAHWCADCKAQGPLIQKMRKEFPTLAVVAPTQRYGYVAGGEEAPLAKETAYISQVQKQHYPWLSDLPMPISEENFRLYGVSSTPTIVVLDRQGLVRLYHPGQMREDELRRAIAGTLN